MKTFAYFPGCSLEKMAGSYHISTIETANKLDVKLKELEDWNCCGATTYSHIDELLAFTLCARNLAIAEKDNLDIVTPCSGCYKNMFSSNKHLRNDEELTEHINFALEEDKLHFTGSIRVHHLIDVFVREVGLDEIRNQVSKPLNEVRVAPYYGCQILRPKKGPTDDIEQPEFFEELLSSLGATPVDYTLKMICCGGSLIATNRGAALSMVRNLLQDAVDCGADLIATACPLCQINLELYQNQVNQEYETNFSMPIVFFTQLMGIAFGIPPRRLGIGKEFVSVLPALSID